MLGLKPRPRRSLSLSLFKELKRRNVFKVGVAYIVMAWLVLQVADVVLGNIVAPEWVFQVLMLFLAVGFPVALFFAWAFELTPDGVKHQSDIDRGASIAPQTGRTLNYIIIGLLAVALIYFVWESRFQTRIESPVEASTAQEPTNVRQSIAVLPFDNRSNREEDQFFTDGIHDDLLTTIANISSMKVISRTSVMEYRDTIKKIPQIAKELGVANILEGGIQRSGNQIRINVQLIDAATDEHLWAEIYDRELTAENLFSIQSEISKAIAEALQATLSPEEVQRIDTVATENLQALEAYLRGRQLMSTRTPENLQLAVEDFNKAVELDPEFALAWVGVADSNRLYAQYGGQVREDYFQIRKDAIDRALGIDDRSGEAFTSLASLYGDQGQFEKASTAYERAIQLSPNYATAYFWYAGVLGRDPLRMNEKIEMYSRAVELDPRSPIIRLNLAIAYSSRGSYSMAERTFLEVIEIDPEFRLGLGTLTQFYMNEMGRFDRAFIYGMKLQEMSPDRMTALASVYINLGDLDAAEKIVDLARKRDSHDRSAYQFDIEVNLLRKNAVGVRSAIDGLLTNSKRRIRFGHLGFYSLALGDTAKAREFYLTAYPDWLIPERSHDSSRLIGTGCIAAWILLNTGDEEAGNNILQQSIAHFDETLRATREHVDIMRPDICYLTAGDTEKALLSIETQLAHNHLYDWGLIHMLPMYDLIRDEPRFQAAVQERERRIAVQREAIEKMNIQSE